MHYGVSRIILSKGVPTMTEQQDKHPNLYGQTPAWRLQPLIDYHKSEKEQS